MELGVVRTEIYCLEKYKLIIKDKKLNTGPAMWQTEALFLDRTLCITSSMALSVKNWKITLLSKRKKPPGTVLPANKWRLSGVLSSTRSNQNQTSASKRNNMRGKKISYTSGSALKGVNMQKKISICRKCLIVVKHCRCLVIDLLKT